MCVNLAIADAIKKIQRLGIPPNVRLDRPVDPNDLILRKNLIVAIAQVCDELIGAVASEAAEHSHQISRGDFNSIVSDALNDQSLLNQFDNAIDELEQFTEEHEPRGSFRAREEIPA